MASGTLPAEAERCAVTRGLVLADYDDRLARSQDYFFALVALAVFFFGEALVAVFLVAVFLVVFLAAISVAPRYAPSAPAASLPGVQVGRRRVAD